MRHAPFWIVVAVALVVIGVIQWFAERSRKRRFARSELARLAKVKESP